MPCDASYMNPNKTEENSKKLAEFIDYLYRNGYGFVGGMPEKKSMMIINAARKAREQYYGDAPMLGAFTIFLCRTLQNLPEGFIIKRGDLYDWWQEHKEADKAREERELLRKQKSSLLIPGWDVV